MLPAAMKRLAAFTLGAAALLGALGVFSALRLERPMPLPAGGILVRVPAGLSLRQVAERLEEAGLVESSWLFVALARWERAERDVHAGEYLFEGAPTSRQVLARLRSAASAERRVIIPEGRTAAEVFALLEGAGLGGADLFACVAASPEWLLRRDLPATGVEGYLFPDTYGFRSDTAPQAVLDTMVDRFRKQAAGLRPARAQVGMSEHQMVTLASLVEKEAADSAERPLIASVFHNRLRLGMPLQSDPTVIYERADPGERRITRADLLAPGDYNTYQRRGLPPGPIANPGLSSLQAALQPVASDYLYFVSRNDGTHQFSRTLEEHNRAVQRYQRSGSS